MFKKVLVPLDLTNKHQAALSLAAELTRQGGGDLVLFHVIEAIPALGEQEEKEFYARLQRAAQAHLDRLAAPLRAQGARCDIKIVIGGRAVATAAQAHDMGADLIVLTSPRFDAERPADSLSSLSWKIGLIAPCPVLLVK